MFELKRTTTSSLSIGAVFIKDPSATVPFAPLISYWHKISSLEAELFVNAPYRIALRKEFKKKYSITAFTELAGSQAFFNISQPIFPEKSIYATLDLKAGMLAEYRFSKKAVLSFSGGLFKTLSSRMAEQNKNINNDYFLKNNNQMMPYINVGVSLLPFLKSFH